MFHNELGKISDIAKKKILVSRVILGEEVAKVSNRFGVAFDCYFYDDKIKLSYTRVGTLLAAYEEVISYDEVKEIEFSIAKLPIRSLHEHSSYIALDLIIRLKDEIGGDSYHLETFAFVLLKQIVKIAKKHNINIIDNLNLVDKYSGLDIEVVKDMINPIYSELENQYNLVSLRTLDVR